MEFFTDAAFLALRLGVVLHILIFPAYFDQTITEINSQRINSVIHYGVLTGTWEDQERKLVG